MAWGDLPPQVRTGVEDRLGAPVDRADGVVGGFSAGFAGVLHAGGRPLFVKATSERVNSHGRALYRQERRACEHLAGGPADTGLAWAFEADDWTVLAFRALDGGICSPDWPDGQLDAVLHHLAEHRTTAPPGLPVLEDHFGEAFDAWDVLAADAAFTAWPADRDGRPLLAPDGWTALARRARRAFAGDQLLHADLRADNVLWTGAGPVVIDWAYACRGAAVFDPLYLLLEVARNRGTPPRAQAERVLARYGCAQQDATALLAALGGWFTWMARMPAPPGLPTLRAFQASMADAALGWCAERLERTPPPAAVPAAARPAGTPRHG
jgi:hypothetical protein